NGTLYGTTYNGGLAAGTGVVFQIGQTGKTLGSCNTPGAVACGNPINVGTGNKFEQVEDYTTVGQNPLRFTRYYNSLPGTTATTLGVNWRSSYDRSLHILSSSSVSVEREDGRILFFALNGGVWGTDSDVDLTLTHSGSIWTLTDSSDTVETYTRISGTPDALLTSIQTRSGYTQQLQYDGNHRLVSVTDSFNRALTFTYQDGLLQTVTTPDFLVLGYSYTASGETPGVLDRLAAVTYSTSPPTQQSYVYENAALP